MTAAQPSTPKPTVARRRRRVAATSTIERAASRSAFIGKGRGGRECTECSGIGGHFAFCDKTR